MLTREFKTQTSFTFLTNVFKYSLKTVGVRYLLILACSVKDFRLQFWTPITRSIFFSNDSPPAVFFIIRISKLKILILKFER